MQLRELSRLTGNSQSGLISDLLDGSHSVLDHTIEVLRAAETAKMALHGNLANSLMQAQSLVHSKLGIVRQGAAERTPEHDQLELIGVTPLSNRGVRLGHKQANGGQK